MPEDARTGPRPRASRAMLLCVLLLAGCKAKPPFEGKSVAELQGMLRSGDADVQVQGAFGLSRLGPEAKAAVPALADALKTPAASVREAAASALGHIGPD